MADMTEKCDVETLACIIVGRDNESIKKMKKVDDAVASRTFGLMGGGIADTLEVTAETNDEVGVRDVFVLKRSVCALSFKSLSFITSSLFLSLTHVLFLFTLQGILVEGWHSTPHGQGC
jgi:hypothetical protein